MTEDSTGDSTSDRAIAAPAGVAPDLVWMTAGDVAALVAAGHLFDDEVRPEWAERFLRQSNHHLCIAYLDDEPVGFVSGVEITHPDKGTEMLLYELGVDEDARGRGIGRALVLALRGLASDRRCTGVWVPVDDDNDAALATYRATGVDEEAPTLILWWELPGEALDGAT